jgi:hypothetical protein
MDLLEKVIDYIIWVLIISGIGWFFYGCYQLIDLFFLRG